MDQTIYMKEDTANRKFVLILKFYGDDDVVPKSWNGWMINANGIPSQYHPK